MSRPASSVGRVIDIKTAKARPSGIYAVPVGPGVHEIRTLHAQPAVNDVLATQLFILALLRKGVGRRGPGAMKPQRNPKYLAWIRKQPCLVCGTRWPHRAARARAKELRSLGDPVVCEAPPHRRRQLPPPGPP